MPSPIATAIELSDDERRLAELSADPGAEAEYAKVLGQVKVGGALTSGLVLVALFLMTTKIGA